MPELNEADKAVLIGLLKATIAGDRYPLSPRLRTLKRVLDKLDPPTRTSEPLPPPKPPGAPSMVLAKKRRRKA